MKTKHILSILGLIITALGVFFATSGNCNNSKFETQGDNSLIICNTLTKK